VLFHGTVDHKKIQSGDRLLALVLPGPEGILECEAPLRWVQTPGKPVPGFFWVTCQEGHWVEKQRRHLCEQKREDKANEMFVAGDTPPYLQLASRQPVARLSTSHGSYPLRVVRREGPWMTYELGDYVEGTLATLELRGLLDDVKAHAEAFDDAPYERVGNVLPVHQATDRNLWRFGPFFLFTTRKRDRFVRIPETLLSYVKTVALGRKRTSDFYRTLVGVASNAFRGAMTPYGLDPGSMFDVVQIVVEEAYWAIEGQDANLARRRRKAKHWFKTDDIDFHNDLVDGL